MTIEESVKVKSSDMTNFSLEYVATIKKMCTWRIDTNGDIKKEVSEGSSRLIICHNISVQNRQNFILFGLQENLSKIPIFLNKHSCPCNSVHFQT